jgi:MFS family permease
MFGFMILLAAMAPNVALELIVIVPMGACGFMLITFSQSILQLTTTPEMRGRVMALWTMAVVGSSAIGGPIIGWVGDHLGPRYGLGVGGLATVLTALLAYSTLVRPPRTSPVTAP